MSRRRDKVYSRTGRNRLEREFWRLFDSFEVEGHLLNFAIQFGDFLALIGKVAELVCALGKIASFNALSGVADIAIDEPNEDNYSGFVLGYLAS